MTQDPYFHSASGSFRFWVDQEDGDPVGASISKETLHYCLHGDPMGADAMQLYERHRQGFEDAVRRRLLAGSMAPVMLRDGDIAALRIR